MRNSIKVMAKSKLVAELVLPTLKERKYFDDEINNDRINALFICDQLVEEIERLMRENLDWTEMRITVER